MHIIQAEISKPTNEDQFQDMCARVYGVVFNDPLPKKNGRRGQRQGGIDVFVDSVQGRIGIQSKRYVDGSLTQKDVEDEIAKADAVAAPIVRLIVATTAANDAMLLRKVQEISDERVKQGKFKVEVEFWHDICGHIRSYSVLQNDYEPNSPGGAFLRQDRKLDDIHGAVQGLRSTLELQINDLPQSRNDSLNTFISDELNDINNLVMSSQYRSAEKLLQKRGADLSAFDNHQKARWHYLQGLCSLHLDTDERAISYLLQAAEIYPNDEQIIAGRIRALILNKEYDSAISEGKKASESYPLSVGIWTFYLHAKTLKNDSLDLSAIPISLQEKPSIMSLLAWEKRTQGDTSHALAICQKILNSSEADFSSRRTVLTIVLESICSDPVKCEYGLFSEQEREILILSLDTFFPFNEKLWPIENKLLGETLVYIAEGYNILRRYQDTLKLVEEAESKNMLSPQLRAIALNALRYQEKPEALLALARTWLHELPQQALVFVAWLGSGSGDVELIEEIANIANSDAIAFPDVIEMLQAFRWIALFNSEKGRSLVAQKIQEAEIANSENLQELCHASHILHETGHAKESQELLNKALSLLTNDSKTHERWFIAETLCLIGKQERAIPLYEKLCPSGLHSKLHNKLLACYIGANRWQKAKKLLSTFPEEWVQDEETRSLAIELGQKTADWAFLSPLADFQLEHFPQRIGSWLFQLLVHQRQRKMHDFHLTLSQVPDEVEGSHKEISQLADIEIVYGRVDQGIRRLYRSFRSNLDDLDIAQDYFLGLVAHGRTEQSKLMEEPVNIQEGSSATLTDDQGRIVTITIDPADIINLPKKDEFYNLADEEVAPFLNKKVGEKVEISKGLGFNATYIVTSITSAFRYLLKVANERIDSTIKPNASLVSMKLPETENGVDFSPIFSMLRERREDISSVLGVYASYPLTLSMLSKRLAIRLIDLICAWPHDATPIFIYAGTANETSSARKLLDDPNNAYVIDTITLTELIWLGCESVLASLPKLYASAHTQELIMQELEIAKNERTGGMRLADVGDSIRRADITEDVKKSKIAFIEKIQETLTQYCEIVPAYGPEDIPPEFKQLDGLLSNEEVSIFRLALEKNAVLFSLDGYLRQLGLSFLNIQQVWPQVVLQYATDISNISISTYHKATVLQFINNRWFVSLNKNDLIYMCLQGGTMLRYGLVKFKEFTASSQISYEISVRIVLDFFKEIALCLIHVGALAELISHVTEGVMRHPNCDRAEFSRQIAETFSELFRQSIAFHPCKYVKAVERVEIIEQMKMLMASVQEAEILSQRPPQNRPVRLDVLFCKSQPLICFKEDIKQ